MDVAPQAGKRVAGGNDDSLIVDILLDRRLLHHRGVGLAVQRDASTFDRLTSLPGRLGRSTFSITSRTRAPQGFAVGTIELLAYH